MCSDDGIALIRVAGEVDYCTAPVLALAVNEALGRGPLSTSHTMTDPISCWIKRATLPVQRV